jgi:hypothetical protein
MDICPFVQDVNPISLNADVLVLQSGVVIAGNILQQDNSGVLMQMEYGIFRYPSAIIKEVRKEAATAPHVSNNGQVIPDWAQIVTLLANHDWAPEIKQVPATVINYGKFNNVPYVSFRCAAGGYELNIFGDLNNPAAVEIGAMSYLNNNAAAKSNCVNFICSILANTADRKIVRTLNWSQKDVQQNGNLSFETLMPGEWGSYGGWCLMAFVMERQEGLRRDSIREFHSFRVTWVTLALIVLKELLLILESSVADLKAMVLKLAQNQPK